MKKIFIMPYFGDLPEWCDKFELPKGYDILLDQDLEGFKKRVKDKLGIDYPGLPGTGKVWDYRCALGYLYQEEIKGYDFWGHTDFDCVYGDVDKWVTDKFLSNLDVHSNHNTYVNGCWSLYRNTPEVNCLFLRGDWYKNMTGAEATGWVEESFSRLLEQSGLRYEYTFWQGNPYTETPVLKKMEGGLYQIQGNSAVEIMMFHFRHTKKWPLPIPTIQ